MTAKDMFEKLGYELVEKNNTSIKYRKHARVKDIYDNDYIIKIWKDSESEPCRISKICVSWNSMCNYFAPEMQAINKQIEELEWNK